MRLKTRVAFSTVLVSASFLTYCLWFCPLSCVSAMGNLGNSTAPDRTRLTWGLRFIALAEPQARAVRWITEFRKHREGCRLVCAWENALYCPRNSGEGCFRVTEYVVFTTRKSEGRLQWGGYIVDRRHRERLALPHTMSDHSERRATLFLKFSTVTTALKHSTHSPWLFVHADGVLRLPVTRRCAGLLCGM
jgi:hypothetical protein